MDQNVLLRRKRPRDQLGGKGHLAAIVVEVTEEDGLSGGGDILEDV